jgi:hypothetical protein
MKTQFLQVLSLITKVKESLFKVTNKSWKISQVLHVFLMKKQQQKSCQYITKKYFRRKVHPPESLML